MSVTRYEFQANAVNRIRGVFEAADKSGLTAVEAFESAKTVVIERMRRELAMTETIHFDRFNAGYMKDVNENTVFFDDEKNSNGG